MASNKSIKGIVIEIDGNTDGLSKSLQDANKRISEVNSALSKVNKSLKLDPSNTELLRQKQELLKDSINETIQKLDKLEAEASAVLPDKEAEILVYCRSGRRSKIAAEELVKLGYTNVKEFGGIIDWEYETVK